MDPVHPVHSVGNFSLQDQLRNNDIIQHTMPLTNIRNTDHQLPGNSFRSHGSSDMQHPLGTTNILMDERGDNLLSSFFNTHHGNDIPVSGDTSFLLGTDNSFTTNQLLMEPTTHQKISYDSVKEPNVSPVIKVNNSPVKKALNKVKQSPFKKRGNFEEGTGTVTFPKSDSKDYSHVDLPRQLMAKMFGLLKEGLFCDSVILSGNTEIRVHRLVLLAACPFILSKMSDLSQNASLKIELPQGIPLDVTSQLVHYLYDGKVTLTSDNVGHFARVANLFKLTHLLDMCKDFVIMFDISQSILMDKGEDVVAIVKNEQSSIAHTNTNKEVKTAAKKAVQKPPQIKTTPPNKKQRDDAQSTKKGTEEGTTIPLHSYGTRRASMKGTSTPNKSPSQNTENNIPKTCSNFNSNSFTETKFKHPIHTNAAFINSNKVGNVKKTVSPTTASKINTSYSNEETINSSLSSDHGLSDAGSRIKLSNNMESTGSFSADQVTNENKHSEDEEAGNIDELTDDCDEDADWKPHSKLKGKAFTKKGRAAKAFKKSYASFIKSAKPKNTAIVPEQKETYTLRPPPKKRAKEFARTEFEELEDILSRPADKGIVHTFSMEAKPPPQEPQKPKRTHRLMKASSYRASQLSAVVAQIEKKAEHLPENERHFICDICGNHYIFSKRAVTHIISVHDTDLEDVIMAMSIRKKEKVLKMCDICGYETKEPNFFYIHFHRYFRHSVPLPKGMQPFKCDICGKECFTRFQLKDHKLIHEEGTPFICETCGQGFNSRTCLTSHVFHKHSKVRNHKCTDYGCEKTFKTRTQLLVHMRSHTGEKPFQCPDCQYKSTTRGNMRLHLTNKHKHSPEIVKNIMLNLRPTQGDELMLDLENDNKNQAFTMQITTNDNQPLNFAQNIQASQETEQLVYSHAPSSQGNHSNQAYATVTSLIASSQDSQILYDPNDPNNRPVTIQHYTTEPMDSSNRPVTIQHLSAQQQSLILNNINPDHLDLLPTDQNLHSVQNNQVLVHSDNLQHHIMTHEHQNTDQSESRLSADINRITVQEARLLLHQQDHVTSPQRQNDLHHQRIQMQDNSGKNLPLVEVQELQPVYLQDQQSSMLQQYDSEPYPGDEEQDLLRNDGSLLQKNHVSNQGQIMFSSDGNQSHLSKIQITIQDRGQLEPSVHGLILSPNNNTAQSSQDNRHQVELLQTSPTKGATKMYLVDVNNISSLDVESVSASMEQGQDPNTAPSIDSSTALSQSYNDPQLLYQLYQQYNQNYQ